MKIIKKIYEKLLDKIVKGPPAIAAQQNTEQTTYLLLKDSETLVKPEPIMQAKTEAESAEEIGRPLKIIPGGQIRTLTTTVD